VAILSCRNLTKRFGSLKAVNDLTFEVGEGETFGIAGPNGSGKTTLFNLITGILRPDSGDVCFFDQRITGMRPHNIVRMGIARTFQIPAVFPSMTLLENVTASRHFGNRDSTASTFSYDEGDRREALEALEYVGLSDRRDLKAKDISLYDTKRLMIASAMATRPKMLFLDEPIAGLTPSETDDIVAKVREINKGGVTVILIEHVMRVLMAVSDRAMILHHGEKLSEGTPKEVSNDEKVIEAYLGERI
jgi:branched-chain amino acid transport system ATP-binding protein